jgi:hypothetical protein
LIRKLSVLSRHDLTRKAIFEFDKLVRSIYPDCAVLDAGKLAKIEMPNRNGFISPNPRTRCLLTSRRFAFSASWQCGYIDPGQSVLAFV